MDYSRFSRKELADILEVIDESVKSRTETDLVRITGRLKDLVCADQGVCGLGTVSACRLERIQKIVNLNYPREWLGIYSSEGLYKSDPVIRYNFEFFRTHLWSEALQAFPEEPYTDLMNRASEFGLKYGVAGGVGDRGRAMGSIFSFSGGQNRFDERHKDIIDIVTPHIHQALLRACEAPSRDITPLSGREKEILRWMREGKTNWEVSVILSISERTVRFHVHNIERKLNAVNKAHAVAIAMESGLL